jgi:hypothetical protein
MGKQGRIGEFVWDWMDNPTTPTVIRLLQLLEV